MEKFKFASGNTESMVPNGVQDREESLTMRIKLGDKSIDDIEAELQSEDLNVIGLYDEDDKLIKNYRGYKYIKSVSKLFDVPVDIEKVEDEQPEETTETEEPAEAEDNTGITEREVKSYHSELVYGDAAEIVLCKSDLRKDVEEMQEVQNNILVAMLEG